VNERRIIDSYQEMNNNNSRIIISLPILLMEKIIPQIKIRKYKEGDFKRAVELDKEAQINQKLKKIYPLTRSDIIRMSPAK